METGYQSINDVFIYPKPTAYKIYLKTSPLLNCSVYIIYDNTGKFVLSEKTVSENTAIELDSLLGGGGYIICIEGNSTQIFKAFKE